MEQQLYKDLILKGGSDMLDFNKIADDIIKTVKSKDDIYDYITNKLLGGLTKDDEKNENLKELFSIIIYKLNKIQPKKEQDYKKMLFDTIRQHL